MAGSPQVSIILPLFNDEDFVAAAIESCLAQTMGDIEILCVDDASTDATPSIVEEFRSRDPRVKLIRQPRNLSAYQARRVGVSAAAAPFVMFLDGDDELAPNAAEVALRKARSSHADVVGFGVKIVAAEEGFPFRFEKALQPQFEVLRAPDIIPRLFPVGEVANGHLWRYLFATTLLRRAYEGVAEDLTFYRANDLPVSFLALAHAKKYVSTPERLYRYHFRRGTSGHAIDSLEDFEFFLSGVDPITAIAGEVERAASETSRAEALIDSYESARLHIIGSVIRYCIRDTSGQLQRDCLTLLVERVGALDAIRAAAGFYEDALHALSASTKEPEQPKAVRSVLLVTAHLETGGLQSVLLRQAAALSSAGLSVTIAVLKDPGNRADLPPGVGLVQVEGRGLLERLDHWLEICRELHVDTIIDHHILYRDNWPWFALAALAEGIPTIGWVHNFALRPLFDGNQRGSFLAAHMRILLRVVTLSPVDVAFWKLQGIDRAVYLPNPPSPLAEAAAALGATRRSPGSRLELAWWGRFDRNTKQVLHLLEVAAQLRIHGVDAHLTIIGPDSRKLTAAEVGREAESLGVDDLVTLAGEQSADQLVDTLRNTDLLVSTSAIEGYQLTILEAQAMGVPVAMYDLPWLLTVRDNAGIIVSTPDDPAELAQHIAQLCRDPERYLALSRAARDFAQKTMSIDISGLWVQLLSGDLPSTYSPEPTLEDAELIVRWMTRFSERNLRGARRGKARTDAELAELRRDRDRAVRKLRDITEGPSFRVGRALTYLPRRARRLLPSGLTRKKKRDPRPTLPSKPSVGHSIGGTHAQTPVPRVDTPDVSVVIPVYNSAEWLGECISSILEQSNVSVEVICVDDGSTDESLSILRQIEAVEPRVLVLHQENSGQSVARNAGIDVARGRYLAFLDSDDYWSGDVLETIVRRADAGDVDVLLFDCVAFRDGDVDDKIWDWYSRYYTRSRVYSDVSSGAEMMAAMRRNGDYRPHVGLYLARTSFVRAIGLRFVPGIVHQDNPYTFRLLLHAARAVHVRSAFYARRIRPGSTITTLTPESSARGYFVSYLEMSRELAAAKVPSDTVDAINSIVDYAFRGAAKQLALTSEAAVAEIATADVSDDAQIIFASLKAAAQRLSKR